MLKQLQENSRIAARIFVTVVSAWVLVVCLDVLENANLVSRLTESSLRLAIWGSVVILIAVTCWRRLMSPGVTYVAIFCGVFVILRTALEVTSDIQHLDTVPIIGNSGFLNSVVKKVMLACAVCGVLYVWLMTARSLERAERKREQAEEQTRQLRDELAHVTRLNTMGQMASGLAHEINQPLTAIANFAAVAGISLNAEEPPIDKLRSITSQITDQAVRAGDIMRRLRSLVDKSKPKRTEVFIDNLLGEVVELVSNEARLHEVTLELEWGCDQIQVEVDPIQLQQVILNLLRNAIDAVMEVNPLSRRIRIESRLVNEHTIEVIVEDSGPGIPFEDPEHAFDAFVTTKEEGLGMGLAISRSIVETHGGELTTETVPGSGARFRLTLPLHSRQENASFTGVQT